MSQDQPINPNDLWRPQEPPAPNKPLTFEKVKQIFADMDEVDLQERLRMRARYQVEQWIKNHPRRFGAADAPPSA